MNSALHNIIECRRCGLCENQKPLLQKDTNKVAVFFVGLSAVKVDSVDESEPLSEETRSGKVLREVCQNVPEMPAYFTNIVKCLPLNGTKIRYPNGEEMSACFSNFRQEVLLFQPKKVVLLGKQVSSFVFNQLGVKVKDQRWDGGFCQYTVNSIQYLCAPHPSYILIYRRKTLEAYKQRIARFLADG